MAGSPQSPDRASGSLARERLESWKEIAAYLRRGVRTVRRWEKEEGLPVHRHLHKRLGTVYAYRLEVDGWWDGRRARLEAQTEEPAAAEVALRRRPAPWAAAAGLAALVLAIAGYIFWRGNTVPAAAPAGKIMLAVLPFEPLGGEADQAYLGDGFTEDLIAELGRMQPDRLGVIARTSVLQYKGTRKTVQQIGRELGVRYVVEGSVRREGGQLRITAQLIGVADQTHLWAQRYDRPPDDLLGVQSEIAAAIARQIAVELPLPRRTPPPIGSQAYDTVLRGRYLLEQRTEPAIRAAIQQFERAIELEPRYASAYAGLAEGYSLLPTYAAIPASDGMSRARQAAREAIRLDESLAEGHAILGIVLAEHDWDWAGAERAFRRAIELNANYAYAHKLYAEFLSYMGRFDEAIAEARIARELDPVSPVTNAVLGTMYYTARRNDEAIEQLQRTTKAHPDHPLGYLVLGLAYGQQQMHTEAIAALEKGRQLSGDNPEYVAQLAGVHARAGSTKQARVLLGELERQARAQYVSPFLFAVVHTSLGENRRALEWLERGYQERLWLMCVLKTEPVFDSLRSGPQYRDLLRRMNFPE